MPARSVTFAAPREVRVAESEIPTPDSDEVLVETTYSAVSPGTELLIYRGDAPRELKADETISALDGSLDYPLRYGYAAVGTVAAVGADVDEAWTGRRVFAFRPHESHFCASPSELHAVPDDCSMATAALLPNVESAVNFAMDGRPMVGERVAVFGQGLVGLLTTAVLSSFPLGELVTVDEIGERRQLSREFGADESIAPEEVGERFDPSGPPDGGARGRAGDGADLTFELSGNPAALDAAVGATGYDGRVVVGSWYGTKPATLDLGGRFHRSRIRLENSQVSTLDPSLRGRWDSDRRLDVAWDYLAELDVERLLTHRVPVDDAERAYELLDSNAEAAVGILFTYRDP
ncbi:zinc-binding alcohol dehydrogenase [Haloprofundus sp. MHR1]|uniref:zinc-binding dehydrogenase n=1 Tax=Haloprofundus sp. MHR1 TaxID=2572921 RepID=UPI0010BEC58E|nr:zinc-binding alcohol dehydrogenase [Haloprofundus sp. MHR1]QCJ47985.1 zinc-binding dehydrogenase [Haloprofundus sp. MHR1]